jgi:murein L,D-transpeptidase YcbB/YkuD
MKKQFLLLAGAALMLASCGGENKTEDQGQSQAQIDSAVNAQVAEREAEMARRNDSMLKAMEAEKAAAEAAAASTKTTKTTKTKTKTVKEEPAPPPPPPPPPPPTVGNGKPKMSNTGEQKPAEGTIGNGKPKMK